MHKFKATEALLQQKLLPLYYHDDAETSIGILRALYDGGVRILEYTNRGPAALENFRQMKSIAQEQMPGLFLGIGTIKNEEQAKDFIDAGADFIVCPSMSKQVAAVTHHAGLLWIPGCMTPTEIAAAELAGASIVKIFPGNILGPGYISAIKELFPGLKFMPTGGVEAEEKNLSSWFGAGVVAVGMGSKLFSKELVEQQNYPGIKQAAIQCLNLVNTVTKNFKA
jgi:2-dehydro-3-deoxyphosphogluconate aldolase / (4S)-4-hydroxy-2-oxoglutarate aldolase